MYSIEGQIVSHIGHKESVVKKPSGDYQEANEHKWIPIKFYFCFVS